MYLVAIHCDIFPYTMVINSDQSDKFTPFLVSHVLEAHPNAYNYYTCIYRIYIHVATYFSQSLDCCSRSSGSREQAEGISLLLNFRYY